MRKRFQQRSYRLIAVRFRDGRLREVVIAEPVARQVVVPVLTATGFGQDIYTWDGHAMTVSGLPVYR